LFDTPRYKAVRLIPFFLLSCLLHSALLLTLPDLTRLFNIHIRHLIPLSRVEMEVALIKPPRPKPKPEPESRSTENPVSNLLDEHASSLIDKHLQAVSTLGDSSEPPPAAIDLPSVKARVEISDIILPLPATDLSASPQDLLGSLGRQSLGRLSGKQLTVSHEAAPQESEKRLNKLISAEAEKAVSKFEKTAKKSATHNYGLSGPVAESRQVLFRPALPKVALVRDVTVSFIFWVRPDGSVSRIETRRIGDLKLVNVAERYLKQWRFSSLSSEKKQTEQWGTVNITFRVPR
jgi:hypothetical protein